MMQFRQTRTVRTIRQGLLPALLVLMTVTTLSQVRGARSSMELPEWGQGSAGEDRLNSMQKNTLWPVIEGSERFLDLYDEARIEIQKEREGETINPSLLTADQRESFFGQSPAGMIIDPQHVLTAAEKSELDERLERHANESDLPVYLIVFSEGQVLPADFDPTAQFEAWFPEGAATMVFYYHGEPDRTSMELSLGRRFLIPDWKQTAVLSAAVKEAETVQNHTLQLGHFLDNI